MGDGGRFALSKAGVRPEEVLVMPLVVGAFRNGRAGGSKLVGDMAAKDDQAVSHWKPVHLVWVRLRM